nr:retrovirus-related Pol polyprotein from transposon TNT 1-94 [Tanacetum cinerariifolium]
MYMTKSLANRLYLKKKLYTYYMSPGTKLGDHIDEFNKLILDLANIDIEIEDEDQVLMLLTSLPSFYENFMETLLYGRESLTMEDILATLNIRELKKRTKGTKEEAGDGSYVRGRSLGGIRNDEMTELVMDSGGSYHMTHRRDFLYDFKVVDGGLDQLGDNRTCTIKRTGKVKIQLHDGSIFILEDVSNDVAAVAQRRLEDKQHEEKTNTDCFVKKQVKVHLGIKVGENITVTGVPGQEGT